MGSIFSKSSAAAIRGSDHVRFQPWDPSTENARLTRTARERHTGSARGGRRSAAELTSVLTALRPASHPVWVVREPGHHVAMVHNAVLGHVVAVGDGSYIAFDAAGTPLGRHDVLAAARSSVRRHLTEPQRSASLERLASITAGVLGCLASLMLAVGLFVTL